MHALLLLGLLSTLAPPATTPLCLWDCDTTAGIEGLERETTLVKQGTGAVRWRNHPAHPGFSLPKVPQDWSAYGRLGFWVHSAKAVPTSFMVIIRSENPATEGDDYWGFAVSLNFTGWRRVEFDLGHEGEARNPRGWNEIDGVTLTAAGWENTPHPDADVVLDDFELAPAAPPVGPRMSDEEFFGQLDLERPDLAAVKAAVAKQDWAAAKDAFLAHLRARTSPKWWFDWRARPQVTPVTGGSDGWDYYATALDVDWTGWKEVVLPLSKFYASRKPLGWDHINYLSLSATYGERTPNPDTVLVLDDVTLDGPKPATLGDFEQDADFDRWPDLQPSTTAHGGRRGGLWRPTSRGSITLRELPHDWKPYQALHFWLWSAKATGERITVIADSDTPQVPRAAADAMKHVFDGYFLGNPINWNANKYDPKDPAFTKEWTYNVNRFPQWVALGDAYWATGDEAYAREWIAQMRSWVHDNPYPLASTGNATLTWRTIEAGIRSAGSWPTTFFRFLSSPSLTGDDAVRFMKSWIEQAHHLMRITVDHPEHQGNWVTMECNGLGHLGILLPEARDAGLWLKTAVDRLSLELDRQVYPDGAQKELTTGYHQVARENFVGLLKFARLNERPMPATYAAKLERMYDYNLKLVTPEGILPPLNDAWNPNVIASLAEGADLFDRPDFRWAATGGAQGTAPDYTSVALPWAGQYVMRSGWGRDDRYLCYESGPYGIGHQHEDKLTLYLYALGRTLLTEAGTYSYDQSKYRRYVLSTWAHNTILVDGQGQHREGLRETYETDQPLDNLWAHQAGFDAADGVYDSGYGPKRDVKVAHERTVVFLRPDYWLVLDRLHGTGAHRYDILWNLNNTDAAQDPATHAAWGTDPNVANLLVTPAPNPALTLQVVKGREDPVLGFAPMAQHRPIPCLDYQLQATGEAVLAWVLTPFRGDRPAVSAQVEPVPGGTVVTVTRPGGAERVFVSERGRPHAVQLGGQAGSGRVVVLRDAKLEAAP